MVGLNYNNTFQKGNTTRNKRSWLFQRFINDLLIPSWWSRQWEERLFWISSLQVWKKCSGWEGWRQPCLQWPWNCEADFLRERKRRMAGWQSNRLWPIQGPTWKNSMGYCPRKKRLKRAGWFSASSSLKNGPCKCAEKSSKSNGRPAWMIKEILNKFWHKKAARADDPGGI